ncbi:hypothetical protein BS17DRAFT_822896 [Gyrodon lividus]|nr:hypothetical protein BS17DRAFT_822896 [Gyrodon lividus]
MKMGRSSKASLWNHCFQLEHRCKWSEGLQPMWRRKREEVMSLQARKKVQMQSAVVDKDEDEDNKDNWVKGAEDDCDVLGVLMEVLMAVVAEIHNMATDWRCVVAESHTQMERILGTLEKIWECLDPEFALEEPKKGLEEEYEEEVVEAAAEREMCKCQSGEEEEAEKDL